MLIPYFAKDMTNPILCHCLLSHQPADLVQLQHNLWTQLGSSYMHCIAYGGSQQEFSKIQIKNVFFVDDDSLRGSIFGQSHIELFKRLATLLRDYPSVEYVYLTEYDH